MSVGQPSGAMSPFESRADDEVLLDATNRSIERVAAVVDLAPKSPSAASKISKKNESNLEDIAIIKETLAELDDEDGTIIDLNKTNESKHDHLASANIEVRSRAYEANASVVSGSVAMHKRVSQDFGSVKSSMHEVPEEQAADSTPVE